MTSPIPKPNYAPLNKPFLTDPIREAIRTRLRSTADEMAARGDDEKYIHWRLRSELTWILDSAKQEIRKELKSLAKIVFQRKVD